MRTVRSPATCTSKRTKAVAGTKADAAPARSHQQYQPLRTHRRYDLAHARMSAHAKLCILATLTCKGGKTVAVLVIDTLRYATRLEKAGIERRHADAHAHALHDELAERMLTKEDLDQALTPIHIELADLRSDLRAMDTKFEAMDAKFEAKFEAVDAQFVSVDQRFKGIDAQFEAVDARFEAVDARFQAVDARFDSMDSKLKLILVVMLFGFTLLTSLGLYQVSRSTATVAAPTYRQEAPQGSNVVEPKPQPNKTSEMR